MAKFLFKEDGSIWLARQDEYLRLAANVCKGGGLSLDDVDKRVHDRLIDEARAVVAMKNATKAAVAHIKPLAIGDLTKRMVTRMGRTTGERRDAYRDIWRREAASRMVRGKTIGHGCLYTEFMLALQGTSRNKPLNGWNNKSACGGAWEYIDPSNGSTLLSDATFVGMMFAAAGVSIRSQLSAAYANGWIGRGRDGEGKTVYWAPTNAPSHNSISSLTVAPFATLNFLADLTEECDLLGPGHDERQYTQKARDARLMISKDASRLVTLKLLHERHVLPEPYRFWVPVGGRRAAVADSKKVSSEHYERQDKKLYALIVTMVKYGVVAYVRLWAVAKFQNGNLAGFGVAKTVSKADAASETDHARNIMKYMRVQRGEN